MNCLTPRARMFLIGTCPLILQDDMMFFVLQKSFRGPRVKQPFRLHHMLRCGCASIHLQCQELLTCTCLHSYHSFPLWLSALSSRYNRPCSVRHHRHAQCDQAGKLRLTENSHAWRTKNRSAADFNRHRVCAVDIICISTAQIVRSAKPLKNPIACELFKIFEARSLLFTHE